uniref:Endonuclease/exonuclease/phosphatase domain-containing protein n=1 Tax=Oreochromis niloticus TaxID=8128 RepID=A0A669C1U0_ORENI
YEEETVLLLRYISRQERRKKTLEKKEERGRMAAASAGKLGWSTAKNSNLVGSPPVVAVEHDFSTVLAGISQWTIRTDTTIGSDHYPVFCDVGGQIRVSLGEVHKKWSFHRADWTKFQKLCEDTIGTVDESGSVEQMNNQFIEVLMVAAKASIPTSKGMASRTLVP